MGPLHPFVCEGSVPEYVNDVQGAVSIVNVTTDDLKSYDTIYFVLIFKFLIPIHEISYT